MSLVDQLWDEREVVLSFKKADENTVRGVINLLVSDSKLSRPPEYASGSSKVFTFNYHIEATPEDMQAIERSLQCDQRIKYVMMSANLGPTREEIDAAKAIQELNEEVQS